MRNNFTLGAALLACLMSCERASAQTAQPDPRSLAERLYYFKLDEVLAAEAATRDARRDDVANVLRTHTYAFVYYAIPPTVISDSFKEFLQAASKARVDKQLGASPSAGAATSVVARTGIASLFDVALEAGALSQTVDQNVVTLRTNADGLVRFLSNQEVFSACPPSEPDCSSAGPFRNLELAASFNAGDAGTQAVNGKTPAGTPIGLSALLNKQDFSSVTARYAVLNSRDIRSDDYRKKWLEWFQANSQTLGIAGADLLGYVSNLLEKVQTTSSTETVGGVPIDQYTVWMRDTRAKLRDAQRTPTDWQLVMHERLDLLLATMRKLDPEVDSKLLDLSRAYARYLALRRDLAATLITDPALTLEFTYAEPQAQPRQYAARVAYAYSPKGATGAANPGTITFNGALEMWLDAQPSGTSPTTSRWKSAQAAVQFDRPLGPADSAGQLSVGAYYQYQFNPGVLLIPVGSTMLPGTTIPLPAAGTPVLGERGSVFAAQATLTIRLAGGMKVPIGVSWANRTELVTGNQVRGHIGVTFDTAPLFLLSGLR